MTKFNAQQVVNVPPAWRQGQKKGLIMTDFARNPVQCQAVRLPYFWAVVRRICYVLAQKGDPTVDQQSNEK